MRDQADQLRQLVHQTVKARPTLELGVPLVVVSGGQAGVGATTVALQLVEELALLGQRAVLVDAHLQQPDVAARCGLEVRDGLAEVLNGNRSAVEVLRPWGESIQLLPGRWTPNSPPEMSRAAIHRLLTELRTLDADVVIVDAGHGMSPWAQHFWKIANQVLLITTTDPAAVMDSYAAVKLAPRAEVDGKVRLVVNRCDDRPLAQRVGNRFAATCRRFLDMHVTLASAVACREQRAAMTHARRRTTVDHSAFGQSMRLLAAEVISSSLVASEHSQSRQRRSETSLPAA